MTEPDFLAAAAALFNAWTYQQLIPTLVLLGMAAVSWSMLRRAQSKGLAIEQMFQDAEGKASSARVFAFGAWCISSWYLVTGRIAGTVQTEEFKIYLYVWGAALIGNKGIDAWSQMRKSGTTDRTTESSSTTVSTTVTPKKR